MKTKHISGKLSFRKETVSDLSGNAMTRVKGGTNHSDHLPCFTWWISREETFCPDFTCGTGYCIMTQAPDALC